MSPDAEIYDVPVDPDAPNNPHAFALRFIGRDREVLEVGCAGGHVTRALVAQGNVVDGIEIDPVAAERARVVARQVVVADLDRIPLAEVAPASGYGAVLLGDVLEHLREPLATVVDAAHLLGPGGTVVVSVPNVAHVDLRLALLAGRWDYHDEGLLDRTHLRFFTRATLRELLAAAGLVAVELEPVRRAPFTSELGLDPAAFAPALVERLLADPDAEIYQFVVRAVPVAEAGGAADALDGDARPPALAGELLTTALAEELGHLRRREADLQALERSRSFRLVDRVWKVRERLARRRDH